MERIFMRKPDLGVLEVFDVAQRSKNSHGRLVNRLFSIYQKSNQRHFTVEYLQCLCLCFCNEKQVGVENSLSFAAKYFAFHSQNIDPSSQDTFILTVYKFLFRHHSGEQMKRVRVCEFINRLLVSMSDDAEIDENVFQLLSNAMLERLQDKVASVRTQAVNALHRLQEPYNADCSIIKAMKYHLEHDPSPEVRTKVLSLIAVTQSTLSTILTRKDDKIATVRKEFYKVVSKIKLVRFTLKQRQEIVRSGFRDRSEMVREFMEENLVKSWFQQLNNDYIEFLKYFDVESFGEVSQKLLFSLFKRQSVCELLEYIRSRQIKERKVVAIEEMNSEMAVLWCSLVTFLMSPPSDDIPVDEDSAFQIIPELTPFTKYIREYLLMVEHKKKQKEFIVSQFLEIANNYWLSDEMGRKNLKQLCIELLLNEELGVCVVPVVVRALVRTIPSVKDRVVTMAEIVSDIRDPLSSGNPNQTRAAQVNTSYGNIDKDIELVEVKLSELSTTKMEGMVEETESRSDPDTLTKCLTIVKEFLQSRDILKLDGVLLTMKDHFIADCLQSKNKVVVSLAVNVLDLMCLRSLSLAKEKFYKFLLLIYDGSIQIPPLQAVFNILINYGFEAFPIETDLSMSNIRGSDSWPTIGDFMDDDSLPTLYIKHLVSQLSNFLESSDREVQIVTCEGFIKLFVSGRLSSPIIMAQLVLLWYSPRSEGEPLIRQPLGLFFANCSTYCLKAPEIICKALVPIVDVLSRASSSASTYYKIEAEPVISVLVGLLRHDMLPLESSLSQSGASYHLKVAEIFCNEIILRGGVSSGGVFCRMLPKLSLLPSDAKHVTKLQGKLKKILQVYKKKMDKRNATILKTFADKLDSLVDCENQERNDDTMQVDGHEVSTGIFNNKDDYFSSTRNQSQIGPSNETVNGQKRATTSVSTLRESLDEEEGEDSEASISDNNSGHGDKVDIEGVEMIVSSARDRIIIPGTPDSDTSMVRAENKRRDAKSKASLSSKFSELASMASFTRSVRSLTFARQQAVVSDSESSGNENSSDEPLPADDKGKAQPNKMEIPDSDNDGTSSTPEYQKTRQSLSPKSRESGEEDMETTRASKGLRSSRLRVITANFEYDSSSSMETQKPGSTSIQDEDQLSKSSHQTRSSTAAKRTRHARGSKKICK